MLPRLMDTPERAIVAFKNMFHETKPHRLTERARQNARRDGDNDPGVAVFSPTENSHHRVYEKNASELKRKYPSQSGSNGDGCKCLPLSTNRLIERNA